MNTNPTVKKIEAQIDSDPIDAAIYETESGRNPTAKNPVSSASGGFQLINATAKALGVKNVMDLEQNYNGYKKLRAENELRFGNDPEMVYAAHFLGAPLLAKYIKGSNLSPSEQRIVNELETKALPRFKKIYQKVLNKTGASDEMV